MEDKLVVDVKGIYSIEKFLISRRLMYWQVYFHKTVVSAESLMINVLKRAKDIASNGKEIYATPTLKVFLQNSFSPEDFRNNIMVGDKNVLNWYTLLDDNDLLISVKEWQSHPDPALSFLAKSLINRKLFRTRISSTPISDKEKLSIINQISKEITHDDSLSNYLLMTGEITNNAYNKYDEKILVLDKSGKTKDMQQASDINLSALTKTVRKYYMCYPKELGIN